MSENIKRNTLFYAGALALLGVVGYLATGLQSVTALIPTFFGIVVITVMFVMVKSSSGHKVIWTLIVMAVIGILATVGGVPKTFGYITGEEIARPAAAVSQAAMAVISAIYAVVMATVVRKKRAAVSPV